MANKLFERVLSGIRIKGNPGRAKQMDVDDDNDLSKVLGAESADAQLLSAINDFREISDNRSEQYDAFDEMEKDGTISAVLQMYADDATQYNLDGDIVWVESDNPDIAAFGNRLIEVLKINQNAWQHIYNLVKYGDIYLETFYDEEESDKDMISKNIDGAFGTTVYSHKIGARIDEYIEMVPNPATIFDLRKRGKTAGFIKVADDSDKNKNIRRAYSIDVSNSPQQIMPADKYIHIMLGDESNRFPETFDITISDDKSENGKRTTTYTVAKGKSILHDAFKSFRENKLMEDSVLLNRVTRSAITRVLQVEVGDMPRTQVRERLRQLKQMIEQRNYMDTNSGTFSNQASPGPVDNVIYVPTRNGNGAISMSSIGGDVDPKSLIDLEYFQQKEAGNLGVPLSYIRQQSGDGGGLSSGTALTKLDNKYARKIKRIQYAYCSGIQTIINLFAVRKNLPDYVNNFKVRMLSPSTVEDADRDEQLNNRVGMLRDIVDILNTNEAVVDNDTMAEIITYMFSTFLNKPEIAQMIQQYQNDKPDEMEEPLDTPGDDFDLDKDNFSPSHSSTSSFTSSNDDFYDDMSNLADGGLELNLDNASEEPAGTEDFGDYEDFA